MRLKLETGERLGELDEDLVREEKRENIKR